MLQITLDPQHPCHPPNLRTTNHPGFPDVFGGLLCITGIRQGLSLLKQKSSAAGSPFFFLEEMALGIKYQNYICRNGWYIYIMNIKHIMYNLYIKNMIYQIYPVYILV